MKEMNELFFERIVLQKIFIQESRQQNYNAPFFSAWKQTLQKDLPATHLTWLNDNLLSLCSMISNKGSKSQRVTFWALHPRINTVFTMV